MLAGDKFGTGLVKGSLVVLAGWAALDHPFFCPWWHPLQEPLDGPSGYAPATVDREGWER